MVMYAAFAALIAVNRAALLVLRAFYVTWEQGV